MPKILRYVVAVVLAGAGITATAQPQGVGDGFYNSLGIDVANILTFLSKKSESYLVNYRHHFGENQSFRAALNMEWTDHPEGYKGGGLRMGFQRSTPSWRSYQRCCPLWQGRWRLHYGADWSFTYRANNFSSSKQSRYGLHPLVGFSFYLTPRFSISTEISVNFYRTEYRNPNSFAPQDNGGYWDVGIGSVGLVMVEYHW